MFTGDISQSPESVGTDKSEGQADANIHHIWPWRAWLRCVTPVSFQLRIAHLGQAALGRSQEDRVWRERLSNLWILLPTQGSGEPGPAEQFGASLEPA